MCVKAGIPTILAYWEIPPFGLLDPNVPETSLHTCFYAGSMSRNALASVHICDNPKTDPAPFLQMYQIDVSHTKY